MDYDKIFKKMTLDEVANARKALMTLDALGYPVDGMLFFTNEEYSTRLGFDVDKPNGQDMMNLYRRTLNVMSKLFRAN